MFSPCARAKAGIPHTERLGAAGRGERPAEAPSRPCSPLPFRMRIQAVDRPRQEKVEKVGEVVKVDKVEKMGKETAGGAPK